ncbi:hypothetical protein H4Q26_005626 [Puccinia striiformis f. sp. tritici PST-130]|nr:hypothetical protein H4Q26_005626 [Puccinia striiformis f. sp. tritici PST-130]
MKVARDLICKTPAGCAYWESFILSESSKNIGPDYFEDTAKQARNHSIREGMPFLYKLIISKPRGSLPELTNNPLSNEDDVNFSDAASDRL